MASLSRLGSALAFGVVVGIITSLLGVDLGFFGYVIAFVVAYAVWEGGEVPAEEASRRSRVVGASSAA